LDSVGGVGVQGAAEVFAVEQVAVAAGVGDGEAGGAAEVVGGVDVDAGDVADRFLRCVVVGAPDAHAAGDLALGHDDGGPGEFGGGGAARADILFDHCFVRGIAEDGRGLSDSAAAGAVVGLEDAFIARRAVGDDHAAGFLD